MKCDVREYVEEMLSRDLFEVVGCGWYGCAGRGNRRNSSDIIIDDDIILRH